jgi:hypothetical protein
MFLYDFYDVPRGYRRDLLYLLSAIILWGGGQQRGDLSVPDWEEKDTALGYDHWGLTSCFLGTKRPYLRHSPLHRSISVLSSYRALGALYWLKHVVNTFLVALTSSYLPLLACAFTSPRWESLANLAGPPPLLVIVLVSRIYHGLCH